MCSLSSKTQSTLPSHPWPQLPTPSVSFSSVPTQVKGNSSKSLKNMYFPLTYPPAISPSKATPVTGTIYLHGTTVTPSSSLLPPSVPKPSS